MNRLPHFLFPTPSLAASVLVPSHARALLLVHRGEQARLLREAALLSLATRSRLASALADLGSVLCCAPRRGSAAIGFLRAGSWIARARRAVELARRDGIAVPGELLACLAAGPARSGSEAVAHLLRRAQELEPDCADLLAGALRSLAHDDAARAADLARRGLADPRLVAADRPERLRAQLELVRALGQEELGRAGAALAPLERARRAGLPAGARPLCDALALSLALEAGEPHAARVAAVRLRASARRATGRRLGQRIARTVAARLARRPDRARVAPECADLAARLARSTNVLAARVVACARGSRS